MSGQQIPDIGVRLSAEGVSDVVRAFQQVSAAAKQSGKDSSKGFGVLNTALGSISGLLPSIGLAAAATGIGAIVKDALDGAVALDKLSQKTGLSIEVLSSLKVAASQTDTDFDNVSSALIRFNKAQGDLGNGSKLTTVAVKNLFGSVTALDGLNTEQRFEKVAIAIGKLPPGFQKTSDSIAFFGRDGANLIPILNLLATEGFDGAREAAAKFGLLLTGDVVGQIKAADDALTTLKLEAQGAALQFTEGFAPALGQAVAGVTTGLAAGGHSGVEQLGEGVGGLVKLFVLGALTIKFALTGAAEAIESTYGDMFDTIKAQFQEFVAQAKATGSAITKFATGDVAGAALALALGQQQVDGIEAALQAKVKARSAQSEKDAAAAEASLLAAYAALNAPPSKAPATPGAAGAPGATTQLGPEATKALLALQQAQLDARLALDKQYDALFAAQDKQQYSQGLISLQQYFDDRTAAIDAEANGEVEALNRQRTALAAAPLPVANNATADQIQAAAIKRRQESAAIDDKIAATQAGRLTQQSQNDIERANAEEALALKRLSVEDEIRTAEGDTYGAAIGAINAEADALKKLGLPPELIADYTRVKTDAAQFAELTKQSQQALAGLSDVQSGLQNQVDAGQLFPFQAVQQYDDAVNAALPHLRDLAAAQIAAAVTPEQQASALQYALSLDKMSAAADQSAKRMADFKSALESGLTTDIADFFSTGIDQAASFADAIRAMALSIVESLQQIVAQMLATMLVQDALGLFSTALPILAPLPAIGLTPGLAEGGVVSGPGSGTSDSIAARLSHGEFVVRASSVAQPGILPLLAEINRGMGTPELKTFGGIPHFADGGMVMPDTVSGNATSGGGNASQTFRHEIHVGLDAGLIERYMDSPAGTKIMLKTVARNPKKIKSMLGVTSQGR